MSSPLTLTDDEIETVVRPTAPIGFPHTTLRASADDEGDTPDDDGSNDDETPVDDADDDGT